MNRLKELRKQHSVSARALATAVGVSHTTIIRAEKAQCDMSIKQAAAIANYFNVSVDYLLGVPLDVAMLRVVNGYDSTAAGSEVSALRFTVLRQICNLDDADTLASVIDYIGRIQK